jgi:hypothetical protein
MLTLSEIFDTELRRRNTFDFIYELDHVSPPTEEKDQIRTLIEISLKYKLLNKLENNIFLRMREDFFSLLEKKADLSFILNELLSTDSKIKLRDRLFNAEGYRFKIMRNDYTQVKVIDYIQGRPLLINDYYIEAELGRGSFGVVYLCIDGKTGEKVVVKKVKKTNGEEKKEYDNLNYLRDECHKYFVCVKEYLDTATDFYIVMEYIEGYRDLNTYRKDITNTINNNGDLTIIRKILENICLGIKEMHKRGLAHNDIKLENIMVNYKTGDIKFIDFGIACIHQECVVKAGDSIMGTIAYMDPVAVLKTFEKKSISEEERIQGDIWAYGALIYFLITGTFPISHILSTPGQDIAYYFRNYEFSTDPNKDRVITYAKKINPNINMNTLLTRNLYRRSLPC